MRTLLRLALLAPALAGCALAAPDRQLSPAAPVASSNSTRMLAEHLQRRAEGTLPTCSANTVPGEACQGPPPP